MPKVHKIDYSPDEFLAGVAGELTAIEVGVYWMICTLIYSRRRAIPDDVAGLAAKFKKTDPRTVRAALESLVQCGKVIRDDGELMVNRCRDELEMASNRIRSASENGSKGGRPRKKTNGLAKPGGLFSEKLSPSPSPSPSPLTPYSPPNDFEQFWKTYPRKVGKAAAERAYAKATKTTTPALIADGLQRSIAAWTNERRDKEFIPHGSTWLNRQSWNDDHDTRSLAADDYDETMRIIRGE